jgi:hypothetical protein
MLYGMRPFGTSAERGKAMKKKAYVKPQLRKLGLLRDVTKLTVTGDIHL